MGKTKHTKVLDKKQQILLSIKKDEAEIKKYGKLLNIKKKNKNFLSDLFSTMDAEFSDEEDKAQNDSLDDVEMDEDKCSDNDEDSIECDEDVDDLDEGGDDFDEDCDVGDSEVDVCEDEIVEDLNKKPLKKKQSVSIESKVNDSTTELHSKIKRNMLQHLNKLCESQMMKCLDGVEEIWNTFPRGDVRDVFLKESISYMKFSCIDFAAFVVSLHIRLSKHTNMIAFYMENLVEKLSAYTQANWEAETTFSTIKSIFKFIAYVTRLETIDCNLIIDLMSEIVTTFALPQLKVLAEVSSIIGFYIRKNSSTRCESFVSSLREKMVANLGGVGDIDEMKSYAQATVDKLTSSKAKSDVVYQSVEKYRKMMKQWSRGTGHADTVALKLADFKGENRVRWWLVGSAVDPSIAHNKSMSVKNQAVTEEKFSPKEKEWNETAKSLGFTTKGKQTLFRLLMRGKDAEDPEEELREAMVVIYDLMKAGGVEGVVAVSEGEVVRALVRCVTLDTEFCQYYVSVMAALLEGHRRFRQIIKCAVWDILPKLKLVELTTTNLGRCVGQLIAVADLPINCLKKYNFTDDSAANKAFMMAVMTEILEENWDDICELMKQSLSTISVKFVNNLRLFLKKNFKVEEPAKYSRSTIFKVTKCIETLQELRRTNMS